MRCVVCGCTDERACAGGCSWFSKTPPYCSRCVRFHTTPRGRAAMDADVVDLELVGEAEKQRAVS